MDVQVTFMNTISDNKNSYHVGNINKKIFSIYFLIFWQIQSLLGESFFYEYLTSNARFVALASTCNHPWNK